MDGETFFILRHDYLGVSRAKFIKIMNLSIEPELVKNWEENKEQIPEETFEKLGKIVNHLNDTRREERNKLWLGMLIEFKDKKDKRESSWVYYQNDADFAHYNREGFKKFQKDAYIYYQFLRSMQFRLWKENNCSFISLLPLCADKYEKWLEETNQQDSSQSQSRWAKRYWLERHPSEIYNVEHKTFGQELKEYVLEGRYFLNRGNEDDLETDIDRANTSLTILTERLSMLDKAGYIFDLPSMEIMPSHLQGYINPNFMPVRLMKKGSAFVARYFPYTMPKQWKILLGK
ncbi:MAG: hypothetical protein KME45_26720 [Stenomitos rutilans HA7619-LM2]|jgi:hypothetical protein|nr:hypothetical protein [Stenomitos rutilans HA7619-LM2]